MSLNSPRCLDSLELQTVAVADSAGPPGLQVEQRLAWAGLGLTQVLTQVQTEESPEGGAGGWHQEPVGRHAASVRADEDQVSMAGVLGGNLGRSGG